MLTLDIILKITVFLILFALGSAISIQELKLLRKKWKVIGLGLILQMIFLPILAFGLVYFVDLKQEWKMGIFLVSICPGGSMSNLISYLVGAELGLSIALTSMNSLLILFSLPLLTKFGLYYFMNASPAIGTSFSGPILEIVFLLFIPTILGLLCRIYFPSFVKQWEAKLKLLSTILLALVFGMKFFASEAMGGSGMNILDVQQLLVPVLLFHLTALIASFFISKFSSFTIKESCTISIEVGLQNTSLAILISASILANNEMSKPALLLAIFSFFSTLIFAFISLKFSSKN
ncbi:MAG: bile acid:sodium symporter [Chitinophagales bacterium]|nr:bile acid:sodium symporter [Chitinophagales bacterium]